jgi:hypothetical protein
MNKACGHRRRFRQTGVALVLVLMITGVLALLILQFALTARAHTARAQRLVERVRADLVLNSSQARMAFALVTQPWSSEPTPEWDNRSLPRGWNFTGKPFQFGDAEIVLQDFNGLVPMPQPGDAVGDYSVMLRVIGLPEERVRTATLRFAETIAPPQSAPLQDFDDLKQISGLSAIEVAQLRDVATLYPARVFNPSTATAGALKVRFADTSLQGLLSLREQGALNAASFFSVTGLGTDGILAFFPGPGFRVTFRVSLGDFVAAEELSMKVDPYAADPFELWSRRRPPATVTNQ